MSASGEKKESHAKRDELLSIERQIQKEWASQHLYEMDAPKEGEPSPEKFFATFPYPYMNGKLHLGHTFTLTKAEFATRYQRLRGKRAIFPFAFHCTGMPIKVSADKLTHEIETYGNPPDLARAHADMKAAKEAAEEAAKGRVEEDPSKKKRGPTAKTKQKGGGGVMTQWEIMISLGIPAEEIPLFQDPLHWIQYFPKFAEQDMNRMGFAVDWRRKFITTESNPYYDSFVRWQFLRLKEKGKLEFGKRLSIYSPKDGQPTMDHDRASGEGVLPNEYTLIKQKIIEPLPEALSSLSGKNVYLIPATLRPETMYGQTNCFVLPNGSYNVYALNDEDYVVCGAHAARNLSYQDVFPEFGVASPVLELKGTDVLGAGLEAPLAKYPVIYVLPMMSIKMDKGTGVVTSVPSDAPDDYATLQDLKNKKALREKYGITDEMVFPFEPVPIISIPDLGGMSAKKVCEDMKIKSQNERKKLDEAKKLVYRRAFDDGVMSVGEYAGKKCSDVKVLIKDKLIAENLAIPYAEPTDPVVSRSGDLCVVALVDQWFINYGEPEWRAQVEEHLKERVNTYGEDTRDLFGHTLAWLKQWACSRSFGLGTKMPFDEQFLIDSLSDSTIYMAYYTIAHLLQGGVVDGHTVGPAGITADQMTPGVWDHVLLGAEVPEGCTIDPHVLAHLRREFNYWYPVDLRVSGKDLVGNHLTFWLYNHIAMFPIEQCPVGVKANGHITLNSAKMSKSTGNFLTLSDAIDRYTADATRLTLAIAGDTHDNADYREATASANVVRLHKLLEWVRETIESDRYADREPSNFFDAVFQAEINRAIANTTKHFDAFHFQKAANSGVFELDKALHTYLHALEEDACKSLIRRYIDVQVVLLAPFTPHLCDHIWTAILKRSTSVVDAPWPTIDGAGVDQSVIDQSKYLHETVHALRKKRDLHAKKAGSPPATCNVFYATSYPTWHVEAINHLSELYQEETGDFPANVNRLVAGKIGKIKANKRYMKDVMGLVKLTVKETLERGDRSALVLTLPMDEGNVLRSNVTFIKKALALENVHIWAAGDEEAPAVKVQPRPCSPTGTFE